MGMLKKSRLFQRAHLNFRFSWFQRSFDRLLNV